MFYGNFKRFKMFFAGQEIPELMELMSLSSQIRTMQLEDAHTLLEQGKGMQAVDELLMEAANLEKRKRDVFNTLTEDKKDILKKYGISITDLNKL